MPTPPSPTLTPSPAQHRYPCENCGASLVFQPGQDALTCPYCGHVQRISPDAEQGPAQHTGRALQWDAGHKAPDLAEIPLDRGLRLDAGSDLVETVRTLSCPNCGARIEIGPAAQAGACPFCATPVATDTGATRLIKPQGMLPFALTQDQARAALGDWLGGLWFAPGGLVQYARRGRQMTGIYSPFWTFDARTRTRYQGLRGDHYFETVYVTRQVNGRMQQVPQQVMRTRWTPVAGQVARDFNDVLVLASSSLPRRFTDALTPWDLSGLVPYDPRYLAGFSAESYTVPLADGHAVARQDMAGVIATDVRRDIGGDVQQIQALDTDHSAETFKHILLPIWTAAYKYNGKSYRFVVDGQSGRVHGDRPWSAWKIALAVALAALVLLAAVYLAERAGYVQIGAPGGAVFAPGMDLPADFGLPPGLSPHLSPGLPSGGGYVIRGY